MYWSKEGVSAFFKIVGLIYDYSLLLLRAGFAPLYHEVTYINNSIFQKVSIYFLLHWDLHEFSTEIEQNAALLGNKYLYSIINESFNWNRFFIILSRGFDFSFSSLPKSYFYFEFSHQTMVWNHFTYILKLWGIRNRKK